jgi:hypothetical protein
MKLQKSITNLLQNCSVRKAFNFTNVTDSFQIRFTLLVIHFTLKLPKKVLQIRYKTVP